MPPYCFRGILVPVFFYCKDIEIFISSGEVSGDLAGYLLAKSLKDAYPSLKISSMGGKMLKSLSDEFVFDSRKISVTGVFEVLGRFPSIVKAFFKVRDYIEKSKPSAVVLIDFPDFNFRVGRFCKKLGIPVFYYISPQVWAWRPGRAKELASFSKRIFVVFPFEVEFYRNMGVESVEYVGHPLVERVEDVLASQHGKEDFGLPADRKLVLLLPGSRENEIKRHMTVLRKLPDMFPHLQFAISLPEGVELPFEVPIPVFYGETLKLLSVADFAVVSSGTATLEAALLKVPSVVIYRLVWPSYILGRLLVNVKYIAMPNILLEKRIFPELIQDAFTAERVSQALTCVMEEEKKIKSELSKIGGILKGGASKKVSERILEEIVG